MDLAREKKETLCNNNNKLLGGRRRGGVGKGGTREMKEEETLTNICYHFAQSHDT